MSKPRWREVKDPKPDIEYWVVIDESQSMPHYFTNEKYANAYAEAHGHTIVFQECFNQRGGVEMPFIAKGVCVVRGNNFKNYFFKTREKASRFWEKCKRKGLCAHLVY